MTLGFRHVWHCSIITVTNEAPGFRHLLFGLVTTCGGLPLRPSAEYIT